MPEQTGTRVHFSSPVHLVAFRIAPLFLAPIILGTLVFWLFPDNTYLGYSVCKLLNMFGGLYAAVVLAYWRMHKLDQKEKKGEASKHRVDAHNAEA